MNAVGSSEILLMVKNLGLRSANHWLLREVSLSLHSGETLAVFGAPGCGKTVLSKVLDGLLTPSRGKIEFGDAGQGKRISFALEKFGLAGELSIYENLALFAQLAGLGNRQRSRKIAMFIELLRLGEYRNLPAGKISKNVAARVEIARALLPEHKIYCLDGNLDTLAPNMLESLWGYLLELRRETGAGLIVTTGAGTIAQMCNSVLVLKEGHSYYYGDPETFRRMAGEDTIFVANINNRRIRDNIKEKYAVAITEEDGFLSFKAENGSAVALELLQEFGTQVGYIYLKRPTMEEALEINTGITLQAARKAREESFI